MKKLIIAFSFVFFLVVMIASAQAQYRVVPDHEAKLIKIIESRGKYRIIKDKIYLEIYNPGNSIEKLCQIQITTNDNTLGNIYFDPPLLSLPQSDLKVEKSISHIKVPEANLVYLFTCDKSVRGVNLYRDDQTTSNKILNKLLNKK